MSEEITLAVIYEKLLEVEKKLDDHIDKTAGCFAALAMSNLEIKEKLSQREQVLLD